MLLLFKMFVKCKFYTGGTDKCSLSVLNLHKAILQNHGQAGLDRAILMEWLLCINLIYYKRWTL